MDKKLEIFLKQADINLTSDQKDEILADALDIGFTSAIKKADIGLSDEDIEQFLLELYRKQELRITEINEIFGIEISKFLKMAADKFKLCFTDIDTVDIDYRLCDKIITTLKKHDVMPFLEDEIFIYVAFKNPFDVQAQDKIQNIFNKKLLKIVLCDPHQIDRHLSKVELSQSIKDLVQGIRDEISSQNNDDNENSSILKLIETILKTAIQNRASDVHIEPTQTNCIIRNRIDGMLNENFILDKDIYAPLVSRLKLLSNIDIAERRKPQDGRFSKQIEKKEYDFRVSTLPIINGESVVIRILDKSKVVINLENLGMSEQNLANFNKALKIPYGIILVTGPTGSGKTTTLYAALNAIKSITSKIITVEDPVEYQLSMIQQVCVNEKIGLNFATALRSILRQDPDIIMIGEIRDKETLQIAIQAALTGHLVFSTLHTNDAISAITRMVDMGIEPYLASGSLIAIEAQRLVRKLCPFCKIKTSIPSNLQENFKEFLPQNYQFYRQVGCQKCSQTGYLGREMISEILTITPELQSLIAKNASKDELLNISLKQGFVSMFKDGILLAANGVTSIEEVIRVAK